VGLLSKALNVIRMLGSGCRLLVRCVFGGTELGLRRKFVPPRGFPRLAGSPLGSCRSSRRFHYEEAERRYLAAAPVSSAECSVTLTGRVAEMISLAFATWIAAS